MYYAIIVEPAQTNGVPTTSTRVVGPAPLDSIYASIESLLTPSGRALIMQHTETVTRQDTENVEFIRTPV